MPDDLTDAPVPTATESEASISEVPAMVPAPNVPAPTAVPPAALPFAVDQSHALDSLPPDAVSTKTPGTMITTVPGRQVQQLPIGTDDILHHLPNGSTLTVLGGSTKQIALTLPANAFRKELTVIGTHVHAAVAAAWTWVKDETATIEATL